MTAVEAALRPLDLARREVFRAVSSVAWSRGLLRRTESRVPFVASVGIAVAFALTCWVPGVLFVLGPAILGVPHVASDVRYLVLRQTLPRTWVLVVAFASITLISLRALELGSLALLPFARVEVGLGWGWTFAGALVGACWASDARRWGRAGLAMLVIGAATTWAVSHATLARGLLAYGHNLVGVAVWVVLFRRRRMSGFVPILLVATCWSLLVCGALLLAAEPGGPWFARLLEEARHAAPGLSKRATVAVALGYVFLQAIHYSVWLSWIPQEAVGRDATLTFAMSARSARRDFGASGLWVIAAASIAVVAMSVVSVHRTRGVYLSLATFHAYLELACLAFLVCRGKAGQPT